MASSGVDVDLMEQEDDGDDSTSHQKREMIF